MALGLPSYLARSSPKLPLLLLTSLATLTIASACSEKRRDVSAPPPPPSFEGVYRVHGADCRSSRRREPRSRGPRRPPSGRRLLHHHVRARDAVPRQGRRSGHVGLGNRRGNRPRRGRVTRWRCEDAVRARDGSRRPLEVPLHASTCRPTHPVAHRGQPAIGREHLDRDRVDGCRGGAVRSHSKPTSSACGSVRSARPRRFRTATRARGRPKS